MLETIGHQRVLVNEMVKRKMRFAGHIIRGSSGFLARLVLEGMIDGKRDRERRTLGDNVKEWSGCESIGRAKRYSEDRDSWRVMVANLLIEDGTDDDDEQQKVIVQNFVFSSFNYCRL